ncbi:MAG: ABC transporter substrate-binding protein [Candidatus Cloacimonetes bacterium]|nr:ABC transporter substrate-binding protein [Candidatus Cloacimonadota bacterium]
MQIRKLTIITLIFLLSCLPKDNYMRIGLIKPSLDYLPLLIAFEENRLNQNDYKLYYFNSGWEANEALSAGRIDAAILPFTYVWSDVANNLPVKIASFLERESDGIIADQNIDRLQELNDKKVGVLRGSTLDIFFEMLKDSLQIKSSELVYFRTPMDMALALESKQVDALSYYVPSIFKLSHNFKIVDWFSNYFPEHPCCDLAVNEKNIRTKEVQLKELISALGTSLPQNKPDILLIDIVSKYYNIENSLILPSLRYTKYSIGLDTKGMNFEKRAAETMFRKGYISRIPLSEEVYYSFQ